MSTWCCDGVLDFREGLRRVNISPVGVIDIASSEHVDELDLRDTAPLITTVQQRLF